MAAGGAAWHSERGRWYLYQWLWLPLLSRIRQEELAEPDKFKAGRLYQAVLQNPGANLAALKALTGLANGTLIYHLDRLVQEGLVNSRKRGHLRLFYPTESAGSEEKASSLLHLRRTQQTILSLLGQHHEVSQRYIAENLDMAQPLVCYHLRELLRKGHIRRRGLRGFYTYSLTEQIQNGNWS